MSVLLLLLTACPVDGSPRAGQMHTGEEVGSEAAECVGVPVVDWDNFGQAFLLHACQGCHASTTLDRYGAPEDVNFDTVDEVWAQADEILLMAAGDYPTMPPRGGVEADDRTRLVWWLECGVPGT